MRSAGAIHKDCSRSPSEPWGEVLWMRTCLSSAECDRMHMTGTLQRVIEAGRIAIEQFPVRRHGAKSTQLKT